MSMFNPEQFVDQVFNESNSTETIPVPENAYTAIVEKIAVRQWVSKTDPNVNGVSADVTWEIDSQEVRELLGRDKVFVRQSLSLDLDPTGTKLDTGKGRNVGLGRLREALDMNAPGVAFSLQMMVGRMAKINVTHRQSDVGVFAEVKTVEKL